MGRPRRPVENGNAESGAESAEAIAEILGPPALRRFDLNRAAPDLEVYVAEAIEGARIEAERQLAQKRFAGMSASESEIDIESRIEKAESYARYRWHGYRNGEIAAL